MKQKIPIFLSVLFFVAITVFIFKASTYSENAEFDEFLYSNHDEDIVIIYNYGGWGISSENKPSLVIPMAQGLEQELKDNEHKLIVVPYKRVRSGFWSHAVELKETMIGFRFQSKDLASKLTEYQKNHQDKEFILLGFSNGASFAQAVFENMPDSAKAHTSVIEVGLPFWNKEIDSERIIVLNNDNRDPIATGNVFIYLKSITRVALNLINSAARGNLSQQERIVWIPQHEYTWDLIGPPIVSFLDGAL